MSELIEEFIDSIPKHIGNMPYLSSNGVSRNEMEWKHICFAMAKEIIELREGGAVRKKRTSNRNLYNELIMAVETKYPDESRHETALRYIQQSENRCYGPAQEAK